MIRADRTAYEKRWRHANPDKYRVHVRRKQLRLAGLTGGPFKDPIKQFEAILTAQGHRCAACGSPSPGTKVGWHCDHNHQTGAFRGVLCHHCNLTLGSAKDDPDRLRALIEYLGRSPCLR